MLLCGSANTGKVWRCIHRNSRTGCKLLPVTREQWVQTACVPLAKTKTIFVSTFVKSGFHCWFLAWFTLQPWKWKWHILGIVGWFPRTTLLYIPEDRNLHNHWYENLKSHASSFLSLYWRYSPPPQVPVERLCYTLCFVSIWFPVLN
jgi:hypothetical protein